MRFLRFGPTHVIFIILLLALGASLPLWPYSVAWGYSPSRGLVMIILVFVLLALTRLI
jgi:hypothetical protein